MRSGVVSATANSSLTSDQQSQIMNTQIPFDTFYGTVFVTKV